MVQAMDAASETLVPIQELVRRTTERLEEDFSKIETKVHRFPRGLQWIGSEGDRYIVPSFVALGPYHHGLPRLQEMEEIKHAAAHYFCMKSGHSVEEVYGKVLSIASEARGCYAENAVARFSDTEFAVMMFLDGCFLLHYVTFDTGCALLENRMILSTGPCILRDIFLLENQLPWLVLDALMSFSDVSVYECVAANMACVFNIGSSSNPRICMDEFQRFRPPHLLGLLRYYLIGSMPPADPSDADTFCSLGSSAIELAETGIQLTASNKRWFADMSVQKGPLFGELSLTPVFLNDCSACWLVNMAAFEVSMSTNYPNDGYTICSYISLLAMLMDKEEDVHELRAKHLVNSFFSNKEMLHFFKGLARHLRLGYRYFVVVAKIEEYKRQRPVRIAVHKFLYDHFKVMVALLSIASVLVGIFRTLMSLKQHQQ